MGTQTQSPVTVTSGQQARVNLSLGNPDFCVIVPKVLFDTASSFIDATTDHKRAYQLVLDRVAAGGGQLLVVGHTDEVGSNSVNIPLSERRARGALAVLTGNTDEWESLYRAERKSSADPPWGDDAFRIMLTETGIIPGPVSDAESIRQHRELSPTGQTKRAILFAKYFQKLLGSPVSSPAVNSLTPPILGCGKRDALGRGNDRPSRRAEFFFFQGSAAPKLRCDDYLTWLNPCAPIPLPQSAQNAFFVSAGGDDVAGDGTRAKPWQTINHALEEIALIRKPGQSITLNVMSGTYAENVTLPADTSLEGTADPRPTVRGTSDAATILISGVHDCAVKNLKVSDGKRSGIRIEKSSTVSVTGSEVSGNFAPRGGGIAIVDATQVIVTDNQIERNVAGTIDTAVTSADIEISLSARLTRFDITIGDAHGGGVFVRNSQQVFISNNRIRENMAILFGGGIAVDNTPGESGTVEIADNDLTCNQVSHGDLGPLGSPAPQCNVKDMGDPVRERLKQEIPVPRIDDKVAGLAVSLLHGLGIESGLGGGVALRNVTEQTKLLRNKIGTSEVTPNRARRGGGIECYIGAYPHIEGNDISFNLSSDDGGGIAIDEFDPFLPKSQPILSFASFRRGILVPRRPIRLIGNQVHHNRAIEDGGGIYATGNPSLEISGSTVIEANRAGQNGGGIRASYAAIVAVIGARVRDNQANVILDPESDKEGGGGIAVRNSEVHLQDCELSGNVANRFAGGAIFFNSTFEGGFNDLGFLKNQRGQFDEIMEDDFSFTTRRYQIRDSKGSGNNALGPSGAGGYMYAVRDSGLEGGSPKGGIMPMEVTIQGGGTAVGENTSEFDKAPDPTGRRKRGNIVIELSGRGDSTGRPEDRATVLADVPPVPTGIALSTPTPDEKAIVVIHNDRRPDDQPKTFPYSNVGPLIRDVSPRFGSPARGTDIAISGSDFIDGAIVLIDNQPATNVKVVTPQKITATAPPLTPGHAPGPVDLTVRNPDGKSDIVPGGFEYANPPAITSVSPSSGAIDGKTPVTILGSGFRPGASVLFGSQPASSVSVDSDTQITATTPASPTGQPEVVDVTVQNADHQTGIRSNAYAYALAPRITDVQLPFGPIAGGLKITITGANFEPKATVAIGQQSITNFSVVTSATIEATTPPGTAGTADVIVTNPDGQQSVPPGAFEYAGPPQILDVDPKTGPSTVSTLIKISGTGFRRGARVLVGSQFSTVVNFVSNSLIEAETPPPQAPGVVDIEVRNLDGQSGKKAAGFTYL